MSALNLSRLFRKLEHKVVNPNGSKYLDGYCKRRKFIWMRDREPETSYYLITLKGNYIRGYKVNYITEENKSINIYMGLTIPSICGETPKLPVMKKSLIAKTKFKEVDIFIEEFRKGSESLHWYDREEAE